MTLFQLNCNELGPIVPAVTVGAGNVHVVADGVFDQPVVEPSLAIGSTLNWYVVPSVRDETTALFVVGDGESVPKVLKPFVEYSTV